jgi:hypothetical protein
MAYFNAEAEPFEEASRLKRTRHVLTAICHSPRATAHPRRRPTLRSSGLFTRRWREATLSANLQSASQVRSGPASLSDAPPTPNPNSNAPPLPNPNNQAPRPRLPPLQPRLLPVPRRGRSVTMNGERVQTPCRQCLCISPGQLFQIF